MKKIFGVFFLCAIIGLLPIIAQLLCFTSGNFACDFITQIVPLIVETKKMLASGAPLWSWNSFLGDNFIGANNFYVLGSPFTFICCLFPYEYIRIGLLLCLLLQYMLFAVASLLYFRRMGFDTKLSALGAFMYTFSSYCIGTLFYFNFAIGIVLFPVFLICIENFIARRRYSVAILAAVTALMVICNFYFAALNLLGGGIYTLFRLCYGQYVGKFKQIVTFGVAVGVGVLLSCVVFVPTVLCTLGSERSSVAELHLGLIDTVYFAVTKIVYILLPKLTEGTEAIYQPYSSFSLYIPCIGFCFVVEYCRKNLRSWLTGLIICYLVILLTPLNIVFAIGANLFYGRWCYIILLVCILASLHVIRENQITRRSVITYVAVVCAALVVICLYLRRINAYFVDGIDREVLLEGLLFAVGSIILIVAFFCKSRGKILYYGVVLVGVANMSLYSYLLVNRAKDGNYNEIKFNPFPRSSDEEFRYRTDVSSTERNLGHIINRGIPAQFHSVFNKSIIELGRCYRKAEIPSITITHHRESFDALTSVKEIIIYKGDKFPFSPQKVLTDTPAYSLYENEHYIPMGFAYDTFITESEFKRQLGEIDYETPQNNKDVGVGLLQTLVVADADASQFKKYLKEAQIVNFEAPLDSVVDSRRMNTAVNFVGNTIGFKATVNNESNRPAVYFFSVPNDPGFTAWMDGNTQLQIYRANLGMMAVVVAPGHHALEFRYLTPGLKLGAWLSLLGLIVLGGILLGNFYWQKNGKSGYSAGSDAIK